MVDESQVKLEAKEIMDSFMDKLSSIEVEETYTQKRDLFSREDSVEKTQLDEDFKTRFLQNAPKHTSDAIVANKGSWVE